MRKPGVAERLRQAEAVLANPSPGHVQGKVVGVSGLSVDVVGLSAHASIGDRIAMYARHGQPVLAEVVGFRGPAVRAMVFGALDGIGPGSPVHAALQVGQGASPGATLSPSDYWLGRVIDPLGQPSDGRGPLPIGAGARLVRASAPNAATRARLGPTIDLGVTVLNAFATCRQGQRLGLFAGSGVGKSTLLSMLARHTACDVAVIALVGERGREVREFLEDDLGPAGLARSVVVAATSDTSPLMRREAAYAAMAVAEHFRDQGKSVLLMMDSVTRFCLALREIGLSAGEPPATRGYPPSVFAELPRLLERAGPGPERPGRTGHITALFTVLVEGDDHNEPISDAVRGILDGHVVLDRRIAESGRYPAVDVLRTLSRTVPGCLSKAEGELVRRARGILSIYADMADLVRLGAYKAGNDPAVDEAVRLAPRIERAINQGSTGSTTLAASFAALASAMESADVP